MIALLHHLGLAFGGAFLWAGTGHFFQFRKIAASIAERGLPAPGLLLAAASVVEICAGTLLLSGIAAPYAAAALATFTVAATLTMLDFWRHEGSEREVLRHGFVVNVAVFGGLLVAGTSAASSG